MTPPSRPRDVPVELALTPTPEAPHTSAATTVFLIFGYPLISRQSEQPPSRSVPPCLPQEDFSTIVLGGLDVNTRCCIGAAQGHLRERRGSGIHRNPQQKSRGG